MLRANRGEILELRDKGCAVLVVSEELTSCLIERPSACNRERAIVSFRTDWEATIERIGEWMSGLWHEVQAHLANMAVEATHAEA